MLIKSNSEQDALEWMNLIDNVSLENPDDPPFGFRIGATLGFGSGGVSFNLTASAGVQYKTKFSQFDLFATGSWYMGGDQLGVSKLTRGPQYDLTLTGLVTVGTGNGKGQGHNMYSINYNQASPFKNSFQLAATYGKAYNFNSAVNAERYDGDLGGIQKSGIIGLKVGNFSLQTSNDTRMFGGGGTDFGHTGQGVINIGNTEFGYQNFTGSHDTRNDYNALTNPSGDGYSTHYSQTPYQKSLNQSFYFIRGVGFTIQGGPNNGGVQNFIHKRTNTGRFIYPNDFRINGVLSKNFGSDL